MARESIWYRVGYQLERMRSAEGPARLQSIAERLRSPRSGTDSKHDEGAAVDALVVAGATALVSRVLSLWAPDRKTGMTDLMRAGLAGAGASFLRELLGPLLHGELRAPELDEDLGQALLAGAARGLLYASLIEPRLPGPALARGLAYGATEYLASPWGGLTKLVGRNAPHRKIPLFSGLFEGYDTTDDRLVDHMAFAVALATLYDQSGLLTPRT